jgi:transcription elongation factor Elf1
MKLGNFEIKCISCGSHSVSLVHRQKWGEEYAVLHCNECKLETDMN